MSLDVRSLLGEKKRAVDEALDRMLPAPPPGVELLDEAMRYSLFAGGKRLRPALVLTVADALGGPVGDAMPSACAIEMIHTYSLIHDDLPSMDDDDLRRGRPTCHVRFGEGIAVLAGDALSNAAFQVIATHTPSRDLIGDLVFELADAAGTSGMIGGQVLDLSSEGREPDLETVRAIHRMKTAALFVASVRLGAIAARADVEQLERVTEFGRSIGLAFQIIDDVLDEESDAKTLGKTAGKDRAQGKMTYPACVGIEASREEARRAVALAHDRIAPLDRKGELSALAEFICARVN